MFFVHYGLGYSEDAVAAAFRAIVVVAVVATATFRAIVVIVVTSAFGDVAVAVAASFSGVAFVGFGCFVIVATAATAFGGFVVVTGATAFGGVAHREIDLRI